MGYIVYLQDSRNGNKSSEFFDYDYHDYLWREGNFSCDCNRSIFLYDDEDKELPCNAEENIINIVSIQDENGTELWCED